MANKNGFTLVELSIVLVIIGLLIGGILVAQSMINAAKINSVIRQLGQYDAAIANFKTKFQQLPADSNLFGNGGDKNGLISGGELGNFWKELSLGVGLKNYKGNDYDSIGAISEDNCPKLNIDQDVSTQPCLYVVSWFITAPNINYYFYKRDAWFDTSSVAYLLKPLDVVALEKKLDNAGSALNGKVVAGGSQSALGGTGCLWNANPNLYNTSGTSYSCMVWIELGISNGGVGNGYSGN